MRPFLSSIPLTPTKGRLSRPRLLASTAFPAVWWLLLLAVTGRAGTVADLDRDDGLPNAKLGAPLSAFQGLEKTEDVGRWLTFKRPSDNLHYGKLAVTGITYNFFKEKLYSINLDIVGRGNVHGIIKRLEQDYGKDHTLDTLPFAKVSATMEVREWSGTKVYCVLKSGSDFEGGVLTLLDKPTWDQLQIPKKEKLEAAKQMLGGSFLDGTIDQPAATPGPRSDPAGTQISAVEAQRFDHPGAVGVARHVAARLAHGEFDPVNGVARTGDVPGMPPVEHGQIVLVVADRERPCRRDPDQPP